MEGRKGRQAESRLAMIDKRLHHGGEVGVESGGEIAKKSAVLQMPSVFLL